MKGERYGRITVIERADDRIQQSGKRVYMWRCVCDCGKEKIIAGASLRHGNTKSCGCLQRDVVINMSTKHGFAHSGEIERLYRIWLAMKERCYNENNKGYKNYGGRGISVCEEWRNSYASFKKWAIESGYDENAKYGDCTIERIDVNGDYCPENCTWVSKKKQANNTRRNHFLTYNGETHTIAEWAEITGIGYNAIRQRINNLGWPIERALTEPMRTTRRKCL